MSSKQREPRPLRDPFTSPDLALSEEESHREHSAALAATVFRSARIDDELVFELDQGCLRLRALKP